MMLIFKEGGKCNKFNVTLKQPDTPKHEIARVTGHSLRENLGRFSIWVT